MTINPPASWKAHKAIPTVQEVESYYTSKHIKTDKLFSSKEKSLSGGTTSGHTSFQPVFSPPLFRAHHELSAKKDTSEIPSTGVPTPSNLESGKLETFKKSEQVATEAVRTAKPYLASPKEFLSHLRGPEKQVPKGGSLRVTSFFPTCLKGHSLTDLLVPQKVSTFPPMKDEHFIIAESGFPKALEHS